MATWATFASELEKLANQWETAGELAGLGILAVPGIQALRGKHVDEMTKHKYDVGGLGVLGAATLAPAATEGLKRLGGYGRLMQESGTGGLAAKLLARL